ncbi:MAG: hypothetical protein RIC35_14655 [Marinoscillum sp.]
MKFPIANCLLLGFLISISSCATYYQINAEFNQNFENGNLEQAEKVLDQNKHAGRKKAQFLYFANQGVVHSMLGDYEESNKWFEKAYLFGEDYQKNYGNIAASFLLNPNTVVYPGEDHEHLLLLYYKALNYLKLSEYEAALVECRRLNNRLNELSDKYKGDNKYKEDAFIHNLMGIIYEASGDVNNAFIAYRNAYNIYEDDYKKLFHLPAPDQLKEDLLRTAYLNGFDSELDFYEGKFSKSFDRSSIHQEELVFFWHNGLGPVKDEWSLNFTAVDGGDGFVTFVNDEMNFSFPYQISDPSKKKELTDIRLFRIAFPKYKDRKLFYSRAVLEVGGTRHNLELAEDVSAIAHKTLDERMLKEFSKGLLRAAVKKSIEMAIRGEQGGSDKEKTDQERKEEAMREGLSLLVGVFNAVTEKADTRNWQTVPNQISYSRIPLSEGQNSVTLKTISGSGRTDKVDFTFDVNKGETLFHTYHSLEIGR